MLPPVSDGHEFATGCISLIEHLNGCRDKYAASMRVLRDLAKLQWGIFEVGLGIELAPLRNLSPRPRLSPTIKPNKEVEVTPPCSLLHIGRSTCHHLPSYDVPPMRKPNQHSPPTRNIPGDRCCIGNTCRRGRGDGPVSCIFGHRGSIRVIQLHLPLRGVDRDDRCQRTGLL